MQLRICDAPAVLGCRQRWRDPWTRPKQISAAQPFSTIPQGLDTTTTQIRRPPIMCASPPKIEIVKRFYLTGPRIPAHYQGRLTLIPAPWLPLHTNFRDFDLPHEFGNNLPTHRVKRRLGIRPSFCHPRVKCAETRPPRQIRGNVDLPIGFHYDTPLSSLRIVGKSHHGTTTDIETPSSIKSAGSTGSRKKTLHAYAGDRFVK